MNGKAKTAAVLILLIAAGTYGYLKWSELHPAGVNNGVTGFGPPNRGGGPGGRQQARGGQPPTTGTRENGGPPGGRQGGGPGGPGGPGGGPPMMAELNLTAEQKAQMEQIAKSSNGDFRKMREGFDKVLTTEQKDKMKAQMERGRRQMEARLKRTLSPQDMEAFKKRMEAMRPPGGQGGPPPGP